ncbi:BZ3500_MvSof-1268-A1-R1_Chr1-3g01580 [Microbotryum saponariae]|uniref:BZ3500_MvSof-1268-A1-R1_Chr1-3g01580 protein n=1 Tax=Microbotryum saponariae TaxID=289078 RepID=A0A2X0KMI6_9BASI|nr:BZ3500_MvSof-1268-A1-R1_Chr1-3g01580 [Microbotryum saponariae]SCZ94087.1 BZ3501_MvSof-1269-A2-R1_Chr1-3g01182 [Microbotryum saponariae]
MHYKPFIWLVVSFATGALAGEKPSGLPPIPPVGETARMLIKRRGLPIKLDHHRDQASRDPLHFDTTVQRACARNNAGLCPSCRPCPAARHGRRDVSPCHERRTHLEPVHHRDSNGSKSSPTQSTVDKMVKAYDAKNCLDSSTNDTAINSLLKCMFAALSYGGANTTVYLCPSAVIPLNYPIYFTDKGQGLSTRGAPTDSTRATIVVKGNTQSTAVYGANVGSDGCTLSKIQIDGSRPTLGWMNGGQALNEMGGTNSGHVISNIRAFEPRGWSVLQSLIAGTNNACFGTKVLNSQIGPAGHVPSGASQFRRRNHHSNNKHHNLKRDSTGTYSAGQWADGISLACSGSVVQGETITDATDGGFIIFQAPGSLVTINRIITDDRQLLGGINAVDFPPHYRNFTGTQVTNNVLDARNSMMKIEIAIGPLSWQRYNTSDTRTFDGGNRFNAANFGGTVGASCDPGIPAFGPMWRNPYTTLNTVAQSLMKNGSAFDAAICNGPGNQTIKGFDA